MTKPHPYIYQYKYRINTGAVQNVMDHGPIILRDRTKAEIRLAELKNAQEF